MFNEDPPDDLISILQQHDELDKSNEETHNPFSYDWEKEYFQKFEWLKEEPMPPPHQPNEIALRNLFLPFMQSTMGVQMHKEPMPGLNLAENTLYMYFISLEQDKMFLHTDFKEEDHEKIMQKVQEKYEYVSLYKPKKIVFTMKINDLYDIDKNVKLFMHMFGINNTRGGSYTSIFLEEDQIKYIEKEKEITNIEYFQD
jgi:hypothetical protein